MEARALGHLLDEKNHSLCLKCKSSKLIYLLLWTIYLLFLRALTFLPRCINFSPQCFQAHVTRIESRIIIIAISIIQIISGRDISYSSLSRNKSKSQRDGSYEGSIMSTGPADNLMVPGDSSIETNYIPPPMFAHQPEIAYIRPPAPGPPYLRRDSENPRRLPPSASAIQANGRRRNNGFQMQSRSLDGAVSPVSFAEPIPRLPIPPVPAFIARMPFVSISDSIYSSSCSTQLPTVSSEAQAYIDILPRRSFENYNGRRLVSTSNGDDTESTSGISGRMFPNAQSGTLAAVAQHYAKMNYRKSRNARSSSAPIPQNTVEDSKL